MGDNDQQPAPAPPPPQPSRPDPSVSERRGAGRRAGEAGALDQSERDSAERHPGWVSDSG